MIKEKINKMIKIKTTKMIDQGILTLKGKIKIGIPTQIMETYLIQLPTIIIGLK